MVTIEPPFYRIKDVTVFRDDEDPDHFHALPTLPALARVGEGLAFTLYKYRRDLTDNPALEPTRARGAGLALFEVEIPLAGVGRLQAEIASRAGRPNARVTPMVFRSAGVHAIVAHAAGDRLIEDLVETQAAPVTSPHHAAFALALSAEGATLFEAAARGGQLPVGVVYELRFLALTPALHARVTMDYDRIYDHFSASVGFSYYVSAKLDVDLAWLVEHELVRIEITKFTDREDQERQQRLIMSLIAARIQRDFFRSGIPPAPEAGIGGPLAQLLGGLAGGEVTSATALFVLKARLEVVREEKTFELTYDGRTAVELTHVCAGFLSTLLAGEAAALAIREIDLDDPFFSALTVEVIPVFDFEEMADLLEATVHLAHGDHRESYSFRRGASEPRRFQVPLTRAGGDEYTFEVEYHFDPDLGGGPTVVRAGPFRSRHRALVVDPLAHFRYRRLRVLLGPVDLASVPRIHVHLRIPGDVGEADLAGATLVLDGQRPEQLWRQRLPMAYSTARVRARTDWEDPRGETHGGDEVEVTGDTFVALGPYRDLLAVSVQPAVDWPKVTQVQVEIRYEDGDYRAQRELVFAPSDGTASQRVTIPLLDPGRRGYRWRQVLTKLDGTASQSEWSEADQAVLVIGQEAVSARDVRVVWVGDAGDTLGLRIDFWVLVSSGDEESVSTFLRAGQDVETVVTLPLDGEGRLRYRYQIQRITAEGGEDVVRVGEGQSNLLVARATS